MKPPTPQVIHCENLFLRVMHFKDAGDTEVTHEHAFGHITLLAAGALRVTCNGKTTDFKAPIPIWIAPNTKHELTALEPNTVASCIHAIRNKDGEELLDPASIPEGTVAMWAPNAHPILAPQAS